jgi:hypothetical protein
LGHPIDVSGAFNSKKLLCKKEHFGVHYCAVTLVIYGRYGNALIIKLKE